jgi:hypothetical protein
MQESPVIKRSIVKSFSIDTGKERLELEEMLSGVSIVEQPLFMSVFDRKMAQGKGKVNGRVLVVGEDVKNTRDVLFRMGRNGAPVFVPIRLAAVQISATVKGESDLSHLDATGNRNLFFSQGAGGKVRLICFSHNGKSELEHFTWPYDDFKPRTGDRVVWMP